MPLLKSEDGMKQILPSKLWISSGRKKTKTAIFDYRARCSVAWDYEGCTYYQRPFREVFAQDKWKTYWILKYQNWKTQKDEPAPPKSFINERAIRYADVLLMLAECYNQTDQQTKAVDLINPKSVHASTCRDLIAAQVICRQLPKNKYSNESDMSVQSNWLAKG